MLPFDHLPYWRGVLDHVENPPRSLPFHLAVNEYGLVSQGRQQDLIEALTSAYGDEHYRFITPLAGQSQWADRLSRRKLAVLSSIVGDVQGKSILEIGGGNLAVAEHLVANGAASCVVIDPALRDTSEKRGVTAIRGYFPSNDIRGDFDLVVSFDCLEHVAHPVEFLASIAARLSGNGVAFLTFPNIGRQFADGDLSALVHEHITYLDESSARHLFELAGLTVLELQKGRDDYFFCLATRGRAVRTAERPGEALLRTAETAFADTISSLSARISAQLDAGSSVCFHGANPGLANFLFTAGLTGEVTIFDGDESKAGSYLPGCSAAIRYSGDSSYTAFTAMWIAAISYADEIIAQAVARGVDENSIKLLQCR